MIIVQSQLTEKQIVILEKLAKKYNIKVSELIRKGVDILISSMPEVELEEKDLSDENKPLFVSYTE